MEQQQQDEERRRQEEESLAESLRIAAYADYHIKGRPAWERNEKRDDGAAYLGNYNRG